MMCSLASCYNKTKVGKWHCKEHACPKRNCYNVKSRNNKFCRECDPNVLTCAHQNCNWKVPKNRKKHCAAHDPLTNGHGIDGKYNFDKWIISHFNIVLKGFKDGMAADIINPDTDDVKIILKGKIQNKTGYAYKRYGPHTMEVDLKKRKIFIYDGKYAGDEIDAVNRLEVLEFVRSKLEGE